MFRTFISFLLYPMAKPREAAIRTYLFCDCAEPWPKIFSTQSCNEESDTEDLVACWGLETTLTGLVKSFSGLLAVRFFLGMCEGGLFPGIV